MADFEEYYKRLYPVAMDGLLRVYTENTDLPHLEKLAIKFIFTIEQKLHPVPQDERRDFIFDVYARISQELLAAVGCLKFGSLSGAYQHYRGFMELHAVLNYVRDKPEKRLKKYAEFSGLAKYQKYEHLIRRLASGEITQEQFDEHNIIWPMDVERFTPEVLQAWRDLWEVETDDELLKKVRLWHHSANIQNLIEKIAPSGPGEAHRYDIACHTVHFSPMTTNLIGRVLIAQHFHAGRIQEITQMIYLEVTQIALLIDDWMGTTTLYQNLAPVLAQFKDSVVRPMPPGGNP